MLVSLEIVWSPVAVQDQTALTAWKCLGLPEHNNHPYRSHSTHFLNCKVHMTQCSCASTRSLTSNNCSVALTLQYIHTGKVRQHTIQSSCKTSARAAPGTSCCKSSAPAAQLQSNGSLWQLQRQQRCPCSTLEQRLPPQTPAWRGPFNTRSGMAAAPATLALGVPIWRPHFKGAPRFSCQRVRERATAVRRRRRLRRQTRAAAGPPAAPAPPPGSL